MDYICLIRNYVLAGIDFYESYYDKPLEPWEEGYLTALYRLSDFIDVILEEDKKVDP